MLGGGLSSLVVADVSDTQNGCVIGPLDLLVCLARVIVSKNVILHGNVYNFLVILLALNAQIAKLSEWKFI